MREGLFVAGTDTEIGKTVLSGLLTHVLGGTYWKPIQSGTVEATDRETVSAWLGPDRVLPERYVLSQPLSPHLSARLDGISIDMTDFEVPQSQGPLIVEGAGGLIVPINEQATIIDLIDRFGLPVILAARSTLGTINHTLLSLQALRSRSLPIKGVVMIGPENAENKAAIEHYGGVDVVGHIPPLQHLGPATFTKVYRQFFNSISL